MPRRAGWSRTRSRGSSWVVARARHERGAAAERLGDAADSQHQLVGALPRRQPTRTSCEALEVHLARRPAPELHRHAARELHVRALVGEEVARHAEQIERRLHVDERPEHLAERGYWRGTR